MMNFLEAEFEKKSRKGAKAQRYAFSLTPLRLCEHLNEFDSLSKFEESHPQANMQFIKRFDKNILSACTWYGLVWIANSPKGSNQDGIQIRPWCART